jgi:hypothetical protein
VSYEVFARICVGSVLRPEAAEDIHREFVLSLGLAATASAADIFDSLRWDAAKHKRHEPDRWRYERAWEAFIDQKWNVDFAMGGLSREGVFDPRKNYLFVGVRVEQFEMGLAEIPLRGMPIDRPQWLRKGDLSPGSDLAKALGPDVRKPFEHACRTYSRANRDVLKDAMERVKPLDISHQHETDWALCRWLVESNHPSVLSRHGRGRD